MREVVESHEGITDNSEIIAPLQGATEAQNPEAQTSGGTHLSCLFVWPEEAAVLKNQHQFCIDQLQELGISVHEVVSNKLTTIQYTNLNGASKGVDAVIWVLFDPTEYQSNLDSFYLDEAKIKTEVDELRKQLQFETLWIITSAEFLDGDKNMPKGFHINPFSDDVVRMFEAKKQKASPYKLWMASPIIQTEEPVNMDRKPDFRDRDELRKAGKRGKKKTGNNRKRNYLH